MFIWGLCCDSLDFLFLLRKLVVLAQMLGSPPVCVDDWLPELAEVPGSFVLSVSVTLLPFIVKVSGCLIMNFRIVSLFNLSNALLSASRESVSFAMSLSPLARRDAIFFASSIVAFFCLAWIR